MREGVGMWEGRGWGKELGMRDVGRGSGMGIGGNRAEV